MIIRVWFTRIHKTINWTLILNLSVTLSNSLRSFCIQIWFLYTTLDPDLCFCISAEHKQWFSAQSVHSGILCFNYSKMLSYRRETALQGALQFSPKVEDWNWETIFCGHYRSIFNHNRPENLSNSVKKRKIRAITAFKVIQGHRGQYQSKARMQFPISD